MKMMKSDPLDECPQIQQNLTTCTSVYSVSVDETRRERHAGDERTRQTARVGGEEWPFRAPAPCRGLTVPPDRAPRQRRGPAGRVVIREAHDGRKRRRAPGGSSAFSGEGGCFCHGAPTLVIRPPEARSGEPCPTRCTGENAAIRAVMRSCPGCERAAHQAGAGGMGARRDSSRPRLPEGGMSFASLWRGSTGTWVGRDPAHDCTTCADPAGRIVLRARRTRMWRPPLVRRAVTAHL